MEDMGTNPLSEEGGTWKGGSRSEDGPLSRVAWSGV